MRRDQTEPVQINVLKGILIAEDFYEEDFPDEYGGQEESDVPDKKAFCGDGKDDYDFRSVSRQEIKDLEEKYHITKIEKCEINKVETRVENNYLKIIVNMPGNLARIHYSIVPKEGNRKPWPVREDAVKNRLSVQTADQYRRNGMIFLENPPKGELCISVIGEYQMPDGRSAYAEPSRCQIYHGPRAEIQYSLKWTDQANSQTRSVEKKCELRIRTSAVKIPEMKLICRSDGYIPTSLYDSENIVLHKIPASAQGFQNGEYRYVFPVSAWKGIRVGTKLRLLLSPEDRTRYELIPDDIFQLMVPGKK